MQKNQLRQDLQLGKTINNFFLTHASASYAELIATIGFDTLTLDMQHGSIEANDLLSMLQAIKAAGNTPIVRLPWNRPEIIMKVLDYGVETLICPMVDTPEEVSSFIQASKYPPLGNRSYGPFRAGLYHEDYFEHANEQILCFVMIETLSAINHLEAIAKTPGLDGLFVGPFDLSVSMGLEKKANFADPQLLNLLDRVLAICKEYQLFSGVFTVDPQDAELMAKKGFQFITCGTDGLVFQRGIQQWLNTLKHSIK